MQRAMIAYVPSKGIEGRAPFVESEVDVLGWGVGYHGAV